MLAEIYLHAPDCKAHSSYILQHARPHYKYCMQIQGLGRVLVNLWQPSWCMGSDAATSPGGAREAQCANLAATGWRQSFAHLSRPGEVATEL